MNVSDLSVNTNTNFIGKKKAFLLHLIESHGERIIDFHEKIPKDEKFRYYNNKPHYSEINYNNDNLINFEKNYNEKENENENSDYNEKDTEVNVLGAVKEEEKEVSFTEQKELNKPLITRSEHYYAFLDKMKLFDLPVEKKTNVITINNINNYNTSNKKEKKNNKNNLNSDLITLTSDKSLKETSSQVNNYFSHEYGKKLKYNSILDWNRNLFNSSNSVKYDYNTDIEFENKFLRTLPNNEKIEANEAENKNLYSLTNKYLELDQMDSPEIYKSLKLKKFSEDNEEEFDLKDKHKEEEQYSFSKIFIEDYVEEEHNMQKDQIQKILDEMHKITLRQEAGKETKIEDQDKGDDLE